MDKLERISRVYRTESEAVGRAYHALDLQQFDTAVRKLLRADRIGASGCGDSGFACMHFVHLMCCIERPARFLHPGEALYGGLGYLLSGDVIVLCSISGRTRETLEIEEACRKKRVEIIAVTEDISSPLARRANIVLRLPPAHEADRFGSQCTTSFAVTNALFDALQNAVIAKAGFTQAQPSADHYIGSVHEQLKASPLFEDLVFGEPSD